MPSNSKILACSTACELLFLEPEDFSSHNVTAEEFDHIFRVCDALWQHSGNPKDPHAELTSGKCSNGFVDVLRVLRYSNLCQFLAHQLVDVAVMDDMAEINPAWVIGSDHAGAALSHSVACEFRAQHDFTEKGPNKTQLWQRFTIQPDEEVLQVEELITTTSTLKAVREGIRSGNSEPVQFSPIVLALVHRSNVYEFEGSPILFLRHYDIETWDPGECPLCKAGSKRVRAKTNWAELTGKKI